MASARPRPVPSAETAPFWEAAARGALRLPNCRPCDAPFFPPGRYCPRCLSDAVEWRDVAPRGRLRSWTALFAPAYPGSPRPTLVAEVEPEGCGGVMLPMAAEDEERLRLSGDVEICFEPGEDGAVYLLAKPVTDSGTRRDDR